MCDADEAQERHNASPPRKSRFGSLAPTLLQSLVVSIGRRLAMVSGFMRAYTSPGTP